MMGRRLLGVIPLLFIVSVMVFGLSELIPGDPAIRLAGENATEEAIEATRQRLGLNDPVWERYGEWISDVARGDLGTSLFSSETVVELIGQRLPETVALTFGALVVTLVVGLPAGVIAAYRHGRWADRAVMLGATSGIALPSYFLAMLLVLTLSIRAGWLPATGLPAFSDGVWTWFKGLIIPSLALGINGGAVVARQVRSSLADILQQDYVRTARAKGMRTHTVVLKHALKNAAIPLVTALGLQVSLLISGTVVVESILGINGLGTLAVTSVNRNDFPTLQGIVMVTALFVIVINLVVDMLYGYLNPRVRQR